MLYRLTEIVHFAGRLTHMEDVMMVTKTAKDSLFIYLSFSLTNSGQCTPITAGTGVVGSHPFHSSGQRSKFR